MNINIKELLLNILPFNNREDMPTVIYIIKKILAFILCLYGAGIICEVVVIAVMMAMGKNPLEGDMFSDTVMSMIMYYGYFFIVLLIMLYWKKIEKKTFAELGLTRQFGGFFIGWGVAVLLLAVSISCIMLTGSLEFNGIFENIDVPLILLYFGGFISQGIYEEVLCRGLLLQTLRRRISLPLSIIICNLPFIILHISSIKDGSIYTILGIANLSAVSLVFSMLTVQTNSLWPSCGLHSFWNFMLNNILGLNLSGIDRKSTAVFDITTPSENIFNGSSYGIEGSLITLTVLVCFGCIQIWYYRKSQVQKASV